MSFAATALRQINASRWRCVFVKFFPRPPGRNSARAQKREASRDRAGSAGRHAIFHPIGDFLTNFRQLEKFGLDAGIHGPLGELPVFGRLIAERIVVVHVTPSSRHPAGEPTPRSVAHQDAPHPASARGPL